MKSILWLFVILAANLFSWKSVAEDLCELGIYRVSGRVLESCQRDTQGQLYFTENIQNSRLSLFLADYGHREDVKNSFLTATGEKHLARYIERLDDRSASYDYTSRIEAQSEEQLAALQEFVRLYNGLSPLLASAPAAPRSLGVKSFSKPRTGVSF